MIAPLFAALVDFNIPPHLIAIIVPVAGMILGGVMAITAMYFRHLRQQLWHETARLALEKGQPLPAAPEMERRFQVRVKREKNDVRTGLILLAVSGGIFVFLRAVGEREAAAVAAIPGFIGLALLLFGVIAAATSKNNPLPDDRPRQP